MELKGAAAIVTGASRGLGRALARSLVARGIRVAGIARRSAHLEEATRTFGDAFLPLACDVRDLAAVGEAVRTAEKTFGRIDVLVNNAGVGRFGPIDALSKEDWDEVIGTNLTGIYHLSREVIPIMKRQGAGHIVNIASIAGLIGNPDLSAYNASKFAVRGMSESLFKELRDFGIKVTAVYPGSVETSFSHSGQAAKNKMTAAEVAETVIFVLERSDNFLISDVVMRPLRPRAEE